MRKLSILFICLFGISVFGADLKFTWDANNPIDEVTNYKLYEVVGTTTNLLATVPSASPTEYVLVSVTPGIHTYKLTAVNFWGDSIPAALNTPNIAFPPSNPKVQKN
ncbi:MAG: hypothetical protein AABY22_13565 [Nanoarchaeota archaeon]